jgi:hypothetical protein
MYIYIYADVSTLHTNFDQVCGIGYGAAYGAYVCPDKAAIRCNYLRCCYRETTFVSNPQTCDGTRKYFLLMAVYSWIGCHHRRSVLYVPSVRVYAWDASHPKVLLWAHTLLIVWPNTNLLA